MTNQAENRRVYYPDNPEIFVELPAVWTGRHLQRRDQAVQAAARFESQSLTEASVALALAEAVHGVPELAGDPKQWDVEAVPVATLVWLIDAVLLDFAEAFIVPKASSVPSPLPTMAMTTESTVGV